MNLLMSIIKQVLNAGKIKSLTNELETNLYIENFIHLKDNQGKNLLDNLLRFGDHILENKQLYQKRCVNIFMKNCIEITKDEEERSKNKTNPNSPDLLIIYLEILIKLKAILENTNFFELNTSEQYNNPKFIIYSKLVQLTNDLPTIISVDGKEIATRADSHKKIRFRINYEELNTVTNVEIYQPVTFQELKFRIDDKVNLVRYKILYNDTRALVSIDNDISLQEAITNAYKNFYHTSSMDYPEVILILQQWEINVSNSYLTASPINERLAAIQLNTISKSPGN